MRISGVGHPHLDESPGEVAGEESLLHDFGIADGLDAYVGAVAHGERTYRFDRIAFG